jgi:hypothetical protein
MPAWIVAPKSPTKRPIAAFNLSMSNAIPNPLDERDQCKGNLISLDRFSEV